MVATVMPLAARSLARQAPKESRRHAFPMAMMWGSRPLLRKRKPSQARDAVCTSSKTSSNPRASQNSRRRFKNPAGEPNADLALDGLDQDTGGLRVCGAHDRVEIPNGTGSKPSTLDQSLRDISHCRRPRWWPACDREMHRQR